ncbi:hypothetical protein CAPTEDRAFT_222444 [Capitella teleta]|uniref:Protein kinase domain-containing protein n=1 Tax=Capitella teleta TaxID=283909 RepID=R7V3I4_CAPTE|nr:hypothetical protein CAPTEDRAFT_222444 [Capitella teleta]|eukprot:ELU13408.1 hypothetical protein CAPTEDRAFT_222444 [Capitella teleta]
MVGTSSNLSPNENLWDKLKIVTRGYYSEKDAAKCVKEMLEAAKYLHENDIVHRDLKPENLLYENNSDDARLKIADFGLSKIISGDVTMQTVCGTPGYCAPEIMTGSQYTSAVDMWSIGVMTFILLCGYEPFYDDNEQQMFKKILKADYEFDPQWWSEVSENAKDLIGRLLVLDPSSCGAGRSVAAYHPFDYLGMCTYFLFLCDT